MKKIIIIAGVVIVVGVAILFLTKSKKADFMSHEIKPFRGSIAIELRLNGSVSPRNRLEIKPQVSGRIENVLVVEGQRVKKGEIIAWMSSTDRAALLDAARSKGEDELKRWEDTYKPTPVISPLDGFIIARDKEPGQSVTTGDAIVVMADTLIIEANVDETDLQYIDLNQKVKILLDAYPDKVYPGVVEHIAYESQVMNNVTVYEVKIRPERVPPDFRAGMTSTIELSANGKDNALLLPSDAVTDTGTEKFVSIISGKSKKTEKRKVITGISNGKNIEIISGISEDDNVVISGRPLQRGTTTNARGGGGIGGIFGVQGRGR
ncbi:MAG: efflux RND transporter periplasmic adaptor subunit [Elusimicrobia bacterium]|nr:efflux RND transporter periplasmic adaptor subunit [Elusimicrobiota bacterium]